MNMDGVGLFILSCSSARRRVSRSRRSERLGGRGIGGRCVRGTVDARGEDGREADPALEVERPRELGGRVGEEGLGDMTGVGACIWIDMARVGRARCGTRPRLIAKRGEEAIGDVLWECVAMGKVWSASDRQYGEGRREYAREGGQAAVEGLIKGEASRDTRWCKGRLEGTGSAGDEPVQNPEAQFPAPEKNRVHSIQNEKRFANSIADANRTERVDSWSQGDTYRWELPRVSRDACERGDGDGVHRSYRVFLSSQE